MNISKQNKSQCLFMAALLAFSSNFNLYSAAHIEQKEDAATSSQVPDETKELTKDELALLKFAKEGNLVGVKRIIALGTNVNCRGPINCRHVENNGHALSKVCSDCEIFDDYTWEFTPLMMAVKYGHIELVKYLLGLEDIDVNFTEKGNFDNALYFAVRGQNKNILKLILDSKKLKCRVEDLYCFLLEFYQEDICSFLINNLSSFASPLADIIGYVDGFDGDDTQENVHLVVVELLTRHNSIDLSSRGKNGGTALHFFYNCNALNIIKHLLSLPRLNPDVKNSQGLTVKDLAERDKNEPVLKMLEECYATRKAITKGLFVAIKTKNIKLLRSALSQFTIAIHDDNGDTTLQAAIKANDPDIINLLLNTMPTLISACNTKTGDNPLHTAIICNNTELIRRLLKCRPNLVDLPNYNKVSPLDLVVLQYQLFLPIFIQATGMPKSTKLDEKSAIVKALITLGADNSPSSSSSSPSSSSTSSISRATSSSSDVSGANNASETVVEPQTKRQRI